MRKSVEKRFRDGGGEEEEALEDEVTVWRGKDSYVLLMHTPLNGAISELSSVTPSLAHVTIRGKSHAVEEPGNHRRDDRRLKYTFASERIMVRSERVMVGVD